MDLQTDKYVCGYHESSYLSVASGPSMSEKLKKDCKVYYKKLLGNGGFICRSNTPFTYEWHEEQKRRLSKYEGLLLSHPSTDPFGSNVDYPIYWTELMGEIFHPLCLKYSKYLNYDNHLKPFCKFYR